MTLMQSPETIILIHGTMVREEAERRRHARRIAGARPGPVAVFRTVAGGALIDLGTRIARADRSQRLEPATGELAGAG